MLAELRVHNLLLIESAELLLHPGLNVITGETGAGKTVLAHALDLLLGGRPKRGIVRPGAEEAYVEGVFALPPGVAEEPELAELTERLPLDRGEVVLARRVTAAGRTRAYLDGRSVSAAELRLLGSRLLSFYGQHEHRKLMLASAQLEILDAFCGREHLERRSVFERELGVARQVQRELEELRDRAGMRERDLDLLLFEIGEIDDVEPSEEEQLRLHEERGRLAASELLAGAAAAALAALDPAAEDGGPGGGALGRISAAEAELNRAAGHDPALDSVAERCRSLGYELEELGSELRSYDQHLEAEPGRLAQIDERLDRFARLKRKHGGSIAAVLEHADRCRADRDRLANAEREAAGLEEQLDRARGRLDRLAGELTGARDRGARGLEAAVHSELGQLAMEGATLEVRREARDGPAGSLERYGRNGGDSIEFMIAPNPGVPAGPLREIASGGELSRVMLALMSVTAAGESVRASVFDEVDAGVGGATARTVGEKLRRLAGSGQVVCITHLPQIASLAQRHFRVTKRAAPVQGSRGGKVAAELVASTVVERLDQTDLVEELCRMLGSDSADAGARKHAEELLKAA